MQFLDLVDVWSFVEGATQSRLELGIVGFGIALFPTTRVLCPFLHAANTVRSRLSDFKAYADLVTVFFYINRCSTYTYPSLQINLKMIKKT